jgi:putative transposase
MIQPGPFKYFKTGPVIIRLAVMIYVRSPLPLRNVEDLLHERGGEISHETVRFWWHRFGPRFSSEIRKRRIEGMKSSQWRWHLDEMFEKINGERHYLWRAVDHEGEVLESFVTKTRDKKAALKFLKNGIRKHGRCDRYLMDKLRSHGAAMKDLGVEDRRETGRWLNNRAENSHLLLRRRERAMLRFPVHAHFAEVRLGPRLRHQPLQHRPQPLRPNALQAEPRRRSRRVARSLRGIRDSLAVLAETGST